MTRPANPSPVVLVDTREQTPFIFSDLPTEPATLATGDYSIRGLDHLVAVERKSVPDLLACIGYGRDRFKRELQRMRAHRFRLLVVEASAADLEAGRWRSQLRPAHVVGALAAWSAQFELPIWLGGGHAACGRYVERYLKQAARRVTMELRAASMEAART